MNGCDLQAGAKRGQPTVTESMPTIGPASSQRHQIPYVHRSASCVLPTQSDSVIASEHPSTATLGRDDNTPPE